MRPDELRTILGRLGLPQTRAAQLLGVNPRTLRAWVLDEAPIPPLVARVMRAADAGRIRLEWLTEDRR